MIKAIQLEISARLDGGASPATGNPAAAHCVKFMKQSPYVRASEWDERQNQPPES